MVEKNCINCIFYNDGDCEHPNNIRYAKPRYNLVNGTVSSGYKYHRWTAESHRSFGLIEGFFMGGSCGKAGRWFKRKPLYEGYGKPYEKVQPGCIPIK